MGKVSYANKKMTKKFVGVNLSRGFSLLEKRTQVALISRQVETAGRGLSKKFIQESELQKITTEPKVVHPTHVLFLRLAKTIDSLRFPLWTC